MWVRIQTCWHKKVKKFHGYTSLKTKNSLTLFLSQAFFVKKIFCLCLVSFKVNSGAGSWKLTKLQISNTFHQLHLAFLSLFYNATVSGTYSQSIFLLIINFITEKERTEIGTKRKHKCKIQLSNWLAKSGSGSADPNYSQIHNTVRRNYLLRFQFRLLTSYGSGSGFVSRP